MLTINRITDYNNTILFGVMLFKGKPFCLTLEEKALAIPQGTYQLKKRKFYKGGYLTYKVCDVPDRQNILIHIGNTIKDTVGCILVGESFYDFQGELGMGVGSSRPAFQQFMSKVNSLSEDERKLKIVNLHTIKPQQDFFKGLFKNIFNKKNPPENN